VRGIDRGSRSQQPCSCSATRRSSAERGASEWTTVLRRSRPSRSSCEKLRLRYPLVMKSTVLRCTKRARTAHAARATYASTQVAELVCCKDWLPKIVHEVASLEEGRTGVRRGRGKAPLTLRSAPRHRANGWTSRRVRRWNAIQGDKSAADFTGFQHVAYAAHLAWSRQGPL